MNKEQSKLWLTLGHKVLASILVDHGAIFPILDAIGTDAWMFPPKLMPVWVAIQGCMEANVPPTPEAVRGRMSPEGELGYLQVIAGQFNDEDNRKVVYHAHELRRLGMLARLHNIGNELAQTPDADGVEDKITEAELELSDLLLNKRGNQAQALGQVVQGYLDQVEHYRNNGGRPSGIPMGLVDLQKILGGWQRGDLIYLAGRPGMGKSSFALQLAMVAAQADYTTAFYSLEMGREQLLHKMLGGLADIDTKRIRLHDLHDDEWPMIVQASGKLEKLPLYIDDTPALSVVELRARTRRLSLSENIQFVIVDYLQLMHGGRRFNSRYEEISEISRNLKGLARELSVPLIVVSQLSRAVEQRGNKRPILSDLRESGSLEQDCDVALFLYRDDYYNPDTELPGVAEVIIAKHRQGPTGILSVYFKKATTQFIDLEVRQRSLEY